VRLCATVNAPSQERVIRAGYDKSNFLYESLTGVGEESCLGAFSLFSAGVQRQSSEESWAERGILSKASAMERTRSFTPSPATPEMEVKLEAALLAEIAQRF